MNSPAGLLRRASAVFALVWLLAGATAEARTSWVVLKDCRLLSAATRDADSFHVQAAGKEYIFRLYFVDAPETDTEFAGRVNEQAKYFGLTPQQTVQLGEHARRFTKEKLSRPFTVRTAMQDAMGRSKSKRYYAFVETHEGDLAELLVINGLARLHGSTAQPLGLSSPERMWDKLQRLEREAKQEKVGAWGASVGRLAARSAKSQPKTGADSFEAFFHPERVAVAETTATAPAVPPTRAPASAASAGGAQLDINAATSSELLNIPGVGPVLAQRIIDARPFASADDLRNVKGIGDKKFTQIRPHFR